MAWGKKPNPKWFILIKESCTGALLSDERRLGLDAPVYHKIWVQSRLENKWRDCIGKLVATPSSPQEGRGPVTVLSGPVKDQAELMGVLNGLYNLRLPLL